MIVGTCGNCGGPVNVPDLWGGVIPPKPTCGNCGAVAANYGPVIQMQPNPCTPFRFVKDTSTMPKPDCKWYVTIKDE